MEIHLESFKTQMKITTIIYIYIHKYSTGYRRAVSKRRVSDLGQDLAGPGSGQGPFVAAARCAAAISGPGPDPGPGPGSEHDYFF